MIQTNAIIGRILATCCTLMGVVLVGVAACGCASNPFTVDERVNRMAREGAARVRQPYAPELGSTKAEPGRERERTAREPGTVNPAASEMSFQPASEARDYAERLRKYASGSGVPIDGKLTPAEGQQVRRLSLAEALRVSQQTGREFLTAQEQYLISAIDLLVVRHQWGPRFFNDTTATLSGRGDDGDFSHALDVVNRLRVTKRLPYGGEVEASWVWNATEQLRRQSTGRYTQASSLVLDGNIPLLRGAGLVAQEDLIQGERNLVYAARTFERFRREYLVDIARDYFELLNAKAAIANQERQLVGLRENAARTASLVDAGRVQEFERGIAQNEVLSAEASLAGQRESYILQLERFCIRLGLPASEVIDLPEDDINVPEPETTLEEATEHALAYRLDLQNRRDQVDDRRRAVANARNALLPQLDLNGSVTVPTDEDARVGGLNFSPDDLRYAVGATLSLPLDREQERLRLRTSVLTLRQAERDYERARDEAVVSVRSALRNIELARFQLKLAEQQVVINEKRLRSQELQRDTVDAQKIVDSQNALLSANNQRDRARTTLRNAVLRYLLESDQLRVARDGTLEPLPGMPAAAAPAAPPG